MPSPQSPSPWTVIVPVKQITLAKSRLAGIDTDTRRALAIAFARDTVAAAAGSSMVERVVVVSNDAVAEDIARGVAELIPDRPDAGLNPALVYAADRVRARDPSAAIAAMSSDLPAARGSDVSRALRRGAETPWFVSDVEGVGTTLLAAPPGGVWAPAFGSASRRAHLDAGFTEIALSDLERLRRDVDTLADLAHANALGVGPATRAVLAGFDARRLA